MPLIVALFQIQRLISYVRGAFKEFILRKFWIDNKTRLKAEQKVCRLNSFMNLSFHTISVSLPVPRSVSVFRF